MLTIITFSDYGHGETHFLVEMKCQPNDSTPDWYAIRDWIIENVQEDWNYTQLVERAQELGLLTIIEHNEESWNI